MAEVPELAASLRDAPPWWTHAEVAIGGALVLGLGSLGMQFLQYDVAALWHPGTWMWLLYLMLWLYSVRRNPDSLKVGPADPTAIEQRLGRVLEAGGRWLTTAWPSMTLPLVCGGSLEVTKTRSRHGWRRLCSPGHSAV